MRIVKAVYRNKFLLLHYPMFRQKLILLLPAHCHNLLKQFSDSMPGEITFCLFLKRGQLGLLSLLVKYRLSGIDLIFCHFGGQLHPLLIQFNDLIINPVDVFPDIL